MTKNPVEKFQEANDELHNSFGEVLEWKELSVDKRTAAARHMFSIFELLKQVHEVLNREETPINP